MSVGLRTTGKKCYNITIGASQNEKDILFQNKDEESVISNSTGSTDTDGFLLSERFHDQYQPQPGCQRESLSQFRNVPSLQT